jgi:hypothetical protein
MTDPTPDNTTIDDTRMPGVSDFDVTIPFSRPAGADIETTAMRVRVPAANNAGACVLGELIAEHVGSANRPPTGAGWAPLFDQIRAVDVDNTPSLPDLLEQVKHWQKIITVVAGKYPTMVQVTADEYATADPSTLVPVKAADDTIMYATMQTWAPVEQGATLGTFLLPAPDDAELPAGHPDPDVRGMKVQNLPVLPPERVELLTDGQWMTIVGVNIGADLGVTVTAEPHTAEGYQKPRFTDLDQVVTIRPVTVPGHGSDLPTAAKHGRQLLTDDGWWTVAPSLVGTTVELARLYQILLVKDPQHRDALSRPVVTDTDHTRTISIGGAEQVLLRDQPPAWWS